MIIGTPTSKRIVLSKKMHVKFAENFLAYINYSINVNYDYIIMKENQDRILTVLSEQSIL